MVKETTWEVNLPPINQYVLIPAKEFYELRERYMNNIPPIRWIKRVQQRMHHSNYNWLEDKYEDSEHVVYERCLQYWCPMERRWFDVQTHVEEIK